MPLKCRTLDLYHSISNVTDSSLTSSSAPGGRRWPSPGPIRAPPPKTDGASSSVHHLHHCTAVNHHAVPMTRLFSALPTLPTCRRSWFDSGYSRDDLARPTVPATAYRMVGDLHALCHSVALCLFSTSRPRATGTTRPPWPRPSPSPP